MQPRMPFLRGEMEVPGQPLGRRPLRRLRRFARLDAGPGGASASPPLQAPARPPPTWGGNLSPFEPPAPDGFPPLIRGPEAPPALKCKPASAGAAGPGL